MKYEKAWKCKTAWRLYNASWKLCHEIVDLRDGHRCVICGERECLDLDHGITRRLKSVFFETDHMNYLCGKHHNSKSFEKGGPVDKRVDLITIRRIGKNRYEELICKAEKVCPQWKTIYHQEEQNELLTELRDMLKIRENE